MHVDTGGNEAPATTPRATSTAPAARASDSATIAHDGRGMDDAGRRHESAGAAPIDEPPLHRPGQAAGDRHRAHHRSGQRERAVVAPDDEDDPDSAGPLGGLGQQPGERLPAHRGRAEQDAVRAGRH